MAAHYLRVEERAAAGPADLVPFFWRILRKSASDPEKIILEGAGTEFRDIFDQLTLRYRALSLRDCPVNMPVIFRRVILRELPSEAVSKWDSYTSEQKKYFTDRYFLVPVAGTARYMTSCELAYAGSMCRYPDGTGSIISESTDFVIDRGSLYVNRDIFSDPDELGAVMSPWLLRTPWGSDMMYREVTLYATEAGLNEVPATTHYGRLVLDEEQTDYFEETVDYNLFIYSLFRVFYTGSTEEALQYFANVLAGSPVIAEEGERLRKIEYTISGGTPVNRITTDRNIYEIPYFIRPSRWMVPGVDLKKDTPVGEFITVQEYNTDPDWIHGETAGDAAYFVNKGTGYFEELYIDLQTEYTHAEIEAATDSQKPRFDIMPASSLGLNQVHTSSYGVWHSVIGRTYVRFVFNDPATSNEIIEQFNFILREILPVGILYSVRVTGEDPAALLDHLGDFLLDHEGEVLVGTETGG